MTVPTIPDINHHPAIDPVPRLPRGYWYWISVLLLLPLILGVWSAAIWTPTHDEYWHLPLGLYALQTGDCRANATNPPLVRMWAALPLWFSHVSLGELTVPAQDAYVVGDAFQRAHPENHRELFFRSRIMMLPFHFLGGLMVLSWSRRWWGAPAGLFAVGLWCGCPVLLGHSALVAHDVPGAVVTFAVFWAAAWYREKPSRYSGWVIGGLIGLACLTKLSAVSLLAVIPVVSLLLPTTQPLTWKHYLVRWLSCFMAWLIVLHFGYLVDTLWGRPLPPAPWSKMWLPRGFVLGMDLLGIDLRTAHPTFLNGEWSLQGFHAYYLYCLLYQMPLGWWLALLVIVFTARTWFKDGTECRRLLALGCAIGAIIGPPSLFANQLGLRYVMPALPIGILVAASAARNWDRAGRLRRCTIYIAAGFALATLRYHPHHLSYFNELAGGPEHGREHLVDSNLDWGQDLHGLRDYLAQHPSNEPLFLAYFGTASPALLGIDYQFPPALQPQPGRYAISANFIAGRPHMLRDLDGRERMLALDEFAPFRFFTPKAMIGYSIGYYEISPEDVARYHRARLQAMQQFGGR